MPQEAIDVVTVETSNPFDDKIEAAMVASMANQLAGLKVTDDEAGNVSMSFILLYW